MSEIPMGLDVNENGLTDLITKGIDTTGRIITTVIDSRTGKPVSSSGNAVAGTGAGFDIGKYAPWIAGGIAGLALLMFVMRR